MKISYDSLNQINQLLLDDENTGRYVQAASLLLECLELKAKIPDDAGAKKMLQDFLNGLLENEDYLGAATLLWGRDKFDVRPKVVQSVIECATKYDLLCIQGASSTSKSYSAGALCILRWLQDPHFTKIRLCSMSGHHLKTNLFSHILDLYRSSALPLPGESRDLFIGLNPEKKDYCILGLTFPQDNTRSTGRLKGIKAGKRTRPHPKYGNEGRVVLLIDEAQNVSSSAFMDLPSILSGSKKGTVQVIMCGNPEAEAAGGDFHRYCEPTEGWEDVDIDHTKEWTSKMGYHVLRLDGHDVENVQKKELIYTGLQTWEGYQSIQLLGINKYLTFCRGMWPQKGQVETVITQTDIHENIGECVFPFGFKNVAGVDLAIKGDNVVVTVGRWGQATGMTNARQEKIAFDRPRWILQIDQQFAIEDIHDDVALAKHIMEVCERMKIPADWLGLDSTIGGSGVYSWLRNYWGDVHGFEWGKAASETKILAEFEKTAYELYNRVSDEAWFGTAEWLRAGAMKISPLIDSEPLFRELTTRRVAKHASSGKKKIETKPEYKARSQGISPDHADSLVTVPLTVRAMADKLPGMDSSGEHDVSETYELPQSMDTVQSLGFRPQKREKRPWERFSF